MALLKGWLGVFFGILILQFIGSSLRLFSVRYAFVFKGWSEPSFLYAAFSLALALIQGYVLLLMFQKKGKAKILYAMNALFVTTFMFAEPFFLPGPVFEDFIGSFLIGAEAGITASIIFFLWLTYLENRYYPHKVLGK